LPILTFRRSDVMRLPLQVLVVSASPIFSCSLQRLLADEPDLFCCWTLDDIESPSHPDLPLIAPQNWEEMAFWLPALEAHFPRCAWLVLGELRVAGMFLSSLEAQRCALVSSSAFPEQLRACALEVVEKNGTSSTEWLLALFNRVAPPLRSGRTPFLISPRQLQCGCAVSLGLSNSQIADLHYLTEATVKSHLHSLMRKLELSDREELGRYFEEALSPLSPPKRWSEIQSKSWKCEAASPTKSRLRVEQAPEASRSLQITRRR
jgi:DNA-binding NarL/FixJ family response regulator